MGFYLDLGFDLAVLASEDPEESYVPGRVAEEQVHGYKVLTAAGAVWARASGRLRHAAGGREELPAVGDFVLLAKPAVGSAGASASGITHVERLLPRRSQLVRKAPGGAVTDQVLAANVDVVFVVTSLNQDFSARRLERYLVAVWDGGAMPVILLSKSDLGADHAAPVAAARRVALGAPVHLVSAVTGEGLAGVRSHLGRGRTAVLVGSSGVGKSSLINALLAGEGAEVDATVGELATQPVREDDAKGRHTTTARSLWLLPEAGGILIDTPGTREFMPLAEAAAVAAVFTDVGDVAVRCRFSNCRHAGEPGCAVAAAVATGELTAERLAAFDKLKREQAYVERRQDARLAAAEKQKWKKISKDQRRRYREGT